MTTVNDVILAIDLGRYKSVARVYCLRSAHAIMSSHFDRKANSRALRA